ncbi:nitroreductase family protein [Albidovulum sp.]|uniref:nitroreductase family protein n=1 Tax=Albidovulum sp. TaxID=1872424 RepID=UPI001DA689D5|nr:nitroreductase [Paracoccaceae bacterium]
MPEINRPVMDFLLARRSRPAKLLRPPVPERDEIMAVLTAAARVPDHGKLEPWRFVVLERPALVRLATAARARGAELALDPDQAAKGVAQFSDAHLIVAVIHSPKQSEKAPAIEQMLSTGAVCLSLLNAALASGWGACWLTGWVAHDPAFAREAYGLAPGEVVAGLIHIGTAASVPPERPRPDLAAITRWIGA